MKLSDFVFHIVEEMEDARYPFSTTDEIESARMDLCRACEHYQEESEQCVQCGCYLPMKVKQVYEYCPIQKWARDSDGWEKYFNRFVENVVKKYPDAEQWMN